MPIYRVDWSGRCYVLADTPEEAHSIATSAAGSYSNGPEEIGLEAKSGVAIKSVLEVHPDWHNSIPFGDGDGSSTVADIFGADGDH